MKIRIIILIGVTVLVVASVKKPPLYAFKPIPFYLEQGFNRIKKKLEARVKLKNPMAPLIIQNIEKIVALGAQGKMREAQDALQDLSSGLKCKSLPVYYSLGNKIKQDISVMLKGDVCPDFVKEVPYIGLILGKIGETENLIKNGDFVVAETNLGKLEKMLERGPAVFSEEEKQELYHKFKEFYREVSQKYFSHNLQRPLTSIENLYADLGLGILSYQDILAMVTEAKEEVKKAKPLSKAAQSKTPFLRNKGKILPPKYGAVFGVWSLDGSSLVPAHSNVRKFEDLSGQKIRLDNIPLEIQFVDGSLKSLDEPSLLPVPGESNSLKIGPPVEILLLRTWASGAIPAIEFHLHEQNSVDWYIDAFGRVIAEEDWVSLQDIIDGKIDAYLKMQAEIIKKLGRPVMFRTINEFNAYAAVWPSFGQDGRKSLFDLCNGKGGREEFFAAASTGDLDGIRKMRLDCPQLYTDYADPKLPDGPERIRDAWRHIRDIFDEAGVTNITWTAQAAPEHGSPNPLFEKVKNWDRMENYWPGRNYLDWGGISGYNQILEKDKNKTGTLFCSAGWWKEEIEKSEWGKLPNILYEFSQIAGVQKNNFLDWMGTLMGDYLPNHFPHIRAIQWIPQNIPLNTSEEINIFKKCVTNNFYWQGEFRYTADFSPPAKINDLKAELKGDKIILSWTAPGDDGNQGRLAYYIIKYRRQRLKNGIDFTQEPWRLWSDYETKIIEPTIRPEKAGTKQEMEISGLDAGTYYFGIQGVDDVPYNSRVSNIITVEVK